MFLDGLEDAYDPGRLMGTYAEDTARAYQFTRDDQDAFAVASLERARAAAAEGALGGEIAPVMVLGAKGAETVVDSDEQPRRVDAAKIPRLKPAFRDGGTVTAANSSSISDGAAALVLMRLTEAERRGLAPLAAVVAHASHAHEPARLHDRARGRHPKSSWSAPAGGPPTSIFMRSTRPSPSSPWRPCAISISPHDKVNVHGGACALGHPIGASGARIMVTLLAALARHDVKRGVAALCIGGGEATAMAVERLD